MLAMATARICPSVSCSSCANMRRQPAGEAKGNSPSITSTKAIAIHRESLSMRWPAYFLAGALLPPVPPLRKTLKNSLLAGSSTITSLLLAKLAL